MSHSLEKPRNSSELYRARSSEEVADTRPILTGDIFGEVPALDLDGTIRRRTVMLVEHPCALRLDGVNLVPKLLTVEVEPRESKSSWTGNFRFMPLPDLVVELGSSHAAAMFVQGCYVTPEQLEEGERIACLSTSGINLLMQRWVHHTTRVVVPTLTFHERNVAVYEEADLVEEWCFERELLGVKRLDATTECMEWLRQPLGELPNRQEQLRDAQFRSTVRKDMYSQLKGLAEIDS
ncbi:hypothetical protein [Streptacidiphilus fuscans]|uniref:Uncharacterized protein n=1 Tax=Streptacidiphilus fuscans TaxID=2789292 RepID=A0A931FIP6_9ACTN|nr:hypothetical protein [Streptacidiphilus fuscans]MBF9073565.1 hypothetical protein [Streptacidiphilus fuscans]